MRRCVDYEILGPFCSVIGQGCWYVHLIVKYVDDEVGDVWG
jgi:hypothetical protein